MPQSRIYGFADISIDNFSLPLTSMIMLEEGRYEIEEPCYYCGDEMVCFLAAIASSSFDIPLVVRSLISSRPR